MSVQSDNADGNITQKILPTELVVELTRWMDPATAAVFLFADKALFDQQIFWHDIASKLKLDTMGNTRALCLKWFKIHRHCLQLMGGRDALTVENWRALLDNRYHYLRIEESIRKEHPNFKVRVTSKTFSYFNMCFLKLPLDYLEWLSMIKLLKNFCTYHTHWDWHTWQAEPDIYTENGSLWLSVATWNDKHEMFLNCDTKHELYGCTVGTVEVLDIWAYFCAHRFVDCYDTELVDESWNHTWHTWLAVITSDRFFEVEDWNDDYRRTAFGEKITSFTE